MRGLQSRDRPIARIATYTSSPSTFVAQVRKSAQAGARTVQRTGGLVWPPLYDGTGGGHGSFPWTVMMPAASEIEALLTFMLGRLSDLGVAEAVLFSGHFADEQLAVIDRIVARWSASARPPKVRALALSQA